MTTTDETTRGGPMVVLMCGVAGSGKTTYAQRLGVEGYVRLSIDDEVWNRFGRHGIGYDPGQYREHSAVAESALRERFVSLIQQGRDVVVDFELLAAGSAGARQTADRGRRGRWRLLYLKVDPVLVSQRLDERSRRFDANAAFPDHQGPPDLLPR